MKQIFIIITLTLMSCQPHLKQQNNQMNQISLIPQPKLLKHLDGNFDLKSIKYIVLRNGREEERRTAEFLQKYLMPITPLSITDFSSISLNNDVNYFIISLDEGSDIPDEGYELKIESGKSIEITASSFPGLFYGYQTFRQLCPIELEKGEKPVNTQIPNCYIKDAPAFGYRGMHLDVSRHFFDIEFVKTYIDMIAFHKMNVFHWHLTDDNGWRIEIKKYPELAEKSAWRVDRTKEPWREHTPIQPGEKATYGGFYTQDEIREVINYADDRGIMVIPEIEMPGHTSEVFAAYPELSCKGDIIPVNPGSYWPNVDIFCAGNEEVFTFLENVLEEVIELFPAPYVHIGGDEAEKTYWETCPKCQKRIQDEGLKNEHELQSYFIKRIEKFLLSNNKKLVGWDEILEGGLAKTATVMSWRGMKGGIESAKAGHDVIMCPITHCYFDYEQGDSETSLENIGEFGVTTLKEAYSFNPIPDELNENEAKYVLGGQANLWTEFVQTPARAQYQILPRMTALSEVLWSGPGKHSYDNFYNRLRYLLNRFDVMEWTHAPGSFVVTIQAEENVGADFKVILSSEKPNEEIRYTLDGGIPSSKSSLYTSPFDVSKTTTIKAAIFINNKSGVISEKTFYNHKARGKRIKYVTQYNQKYPGNGHITLTDGLTGSDYHNDGYWLGWEGNDLDVIIDLEKIEAISKISMGFLEAQQSWIFLPTELVISFSTNGDLFESNQSLQLSDGNRNDDPVRKILVIDNLQQSAQFVRVQAISRKICPDWHKGAGGKVWIFSDEIVIE